MKIADDNRAWKEPSSQKIESPTCETLNTSLTDNAASLRIPSWSEEIDENPSIGTLYSEMLNELERVRELPVMEDLLSRPSWSMDHTHQDLLPEILHRIRKSDTHHLLAHNQIDSLYVSVHMEFRQHHHFDALYAWLDWAKAHDNVAVVVVPHLPRNLSPQELEHELHGTVDIETYAPFYEETCRWNRCAEELLGPRFAYWPRHMPGSWVNAEEADAGEFVSLRFNVERQQFDGYRDDFLFRSAHVFGQLVHCCAHKQWEALLTGGFAPEIERPTIVPTFPPRG